MDYSVVLKPVAQKGYWRVQLAWPNKTVHFVGKFLSLAEAEKWIEQHRWLQREKPMSQREIKRNVENPD